MGEKWVTHHCFCHAPPCPAGVNHQPQLGRFCFSDGCTLEHPLSKQAFLNEIIVLLTYILTFLLHFPCSYIERKHWTRTCTENVYVFACMWVCQDLSCFSRLAFWFSWSCTYFLGLAKLLCLACFVVSSSEAGCRPEDTLAAAGPTDQWAEAGREQSLYRAAGEWQQAKFRFVGTHP